MSSLSFLPEAVKNLQKALSKLQGVGEKTALRYVLYLLKYPNLIKELINSLQTFANDIKLCSICFNLCEGDKCSVCLDPSREKDKICVVETVQDVISIERSGEYKGLYHVLMGKLSPLKGVTHKDITVDKLFERCKSCDIKEVFLATNIDVDGETTALYIKKEISPLNIKITRLAVGIPVGGEIEYLDPATLKRAIKGRSVMD